MGISSFKLRKTELSFTDLDTPYQYHFIKELLFTVLGFLITAILFIIIKEWLYILFSLLLAFGYSLYVIWQIYKSLSNQVLVVDAKCIELERKESKLFGTLSKRCHNI